MGHLRKIAAISGLLARALPDVAPTTRAALPRAQRSGQRSARGGRHVGQRPGEQPTNRRYLPQMAHPVMGLDAMNRVLAGAAEVFGPEEHNQAPLPETSTSYIKALMRVPASDAPAMPAAIPVPAAPAAPAAIPVPAPAAIPVPAAPADKASKNPVSWAELDEQLLDFSPPPTTHRGSSRAKK